MSGRLWFVAVPFIAGAILALTTDLGWAFSQQTVTPNANANGNYNFNYGALDDKNKFGDSTNKSDANSPGFHFGVQHGQSGGLHSFGGDNNAPPSQPYFRTFGN